jgi:hypothetical protein
MNKESPMSTVTVEFDTAALFSRVKNKSYLVRSSLWFVLPELTNDRVRKLFGTGMADQDKAKYSKSIVIKSLITGNLYTLYKSYGIWRVGANLISPIDRKMLEKILG